MVVIMVGPECEGTPRALTQEAAVFSATESLGSPMPRGRGLVEAHGGHAAERGGRR
jgi:hypothetical protein